eukprot:4733450-Pyramimonas_sp.AAC.1
MSLLGWLPIGGRWIWNCIELWRKLVLVVILVVLRRLLAISRQASLTCGRARTDSLGCDQHTGKP